MEISGELLHYLKTGGKILFVILLLPLGAYLREQTYRNVHGNATIGRDLEFLLERLKQWRKKKNKSKSSNSSNSSNGNNKNII
jgi:hypothetical protein